MKTLYVLVSTFLLSAFLSKAQKEANHWYFGPGLDFSNGAPVLDNNSRNVNNHAVGEGVSTTSDENGNLLFYHYNMDTVYNKMHQPMANGNGVHANVSSTQGSIAFKKPGSTHLYCMFTQTGLGPNWSNTPTGLYYNEIDMSLASGNGSVTIKNLSIDTHTAFAKWESLAAVKHCNGIDYWVLVRELMPLSNVYKAYLVTAAGVSMTPVTSTVGPAHQNVWQGLTKFSPTGRKVAATSFNQQPPVILDFDPLTGVLSNDIVLNQMGNYMEFSPDGTKLYTSGFDGTNILLHQWDLCAGSTSLSLLNSRYTLTVQPKATANLNFGNFQLGPDGKIYMCSMQTPISYSLSVINNPNASGSACNFVLMGLPTGTVKPQWALPAFESTIFKSISTTASHTVGSCNNVMFSTPPFSTVSCSAINPYTGVNWIFGDPASGTANTSTLHAPTHTFSAPGIYTVKLALLSSCAADTIYQTVKVTSGATLQATDSKTVCLGEKVILSASGASSYSWSTGATTSSITVTASISAAYLVTSTISPGCLASKTISITVSECTGFKDNLAGSVVKIYPVPASDQVIIDVPEHSTFTITDLTGRKVKQGTLQKGTQELNVSELRSGLYMVTLENGASQHVSRLVIQR